MDNFGISSPHVPDAGVSNSVSVEPHIGGWPQLRMLELGDAERAERRAFIGGSDANIILSGNADRVTRLWQEKRGEIESEDLSGCLAVMLGCWTEAFNRQWFVQLSGSKVIDVGQTLQCPNHKWRRSTLDGRLEVNGAVWEAKHTSAFAKSDEVLERYMPQLQHNMAVTGAERAVLSVIFGNHKYEMIEVAADWLYQLELLEAEEQFWKCVATGRRPVAVPPPPAPPRLGTREICLEGNNAWASAAADWLGYRDAAKAHASAVNVIKSLIEQDVSRAFGHGIEAKRSKAGAITIRELLA